VATRELSRQDLRVLAIVPCAQCFGLQSVTLAFFGQMPDWVESHFVNTLWTDGEFGRRLDALKITHSSTWLGMISRKLDRTNLAMTFQCLLRLPIAWCDILQIYRKFRPDIIYLANYHEAILLWPLLLWVRRRVVCHMHDPPPAIAFQKIAFFVWRRAIGRFLFISQDVRQRLAYLGPPGITDVTIYNGVAVTPLALPRCRNMRFCELFGWSEDSVIFGMTGQINSSKGHTEFIEAAYVAHRSNQKTRFVIGGKRESNQFIGELQDRILDRGLNEFVRFSEWLPDPKDFYESIDVLVLASRHEEGFGLVLAEAGERGLPAISTRSGGAVEVILDGETGIVVEKQDTSALALAIRQIAGDEEMRRRMGQRARQRIIDEFNLVVQSSRFAKFLYETGRNIWK
jgi:glycosyltransferase involved in cell wall biosynthesis